MVTTRPPPAPAWLQGHAWLCASSCCSWEASSSPTAERGLLRSDHIFPGGAQASVAFSLSRPPRAHPGKDAQSCMQILCFTTGTLTTDRPAVSAQIHVQTHTHTDTPLTVQQ